MEHGGVREERKYGEKIGWIPAGLIPTSDKGPSDGPKLPLFGGSTVLLTPVYFVDLSNAMLEHITILSMFFLHLRYTQKMKF